jgi:hypothetical protein
MVLKSILKFEAPIVFKKGKSITAHAMSKLAINMIARSFSTHLQHFIFGYGLIFFLCFLFFFFFGVSFKAGISFKKSI